MSEQRGALLFDLDGTLIDTAPDMGEALNRLLAEESLAPLSPQIMRPHVSHGSKALVALGFGTQLSEEREHALIARYLQCYTDCVAEQSAIFEGLQYLLEELEAEGTPWGIITNKPVRYTVPLLAHLQLLSRCSALVCGDSLARRKPDPEPLLLACRRAQLTPQRCVYVGDAERDIAAGSAAHMRTAVVGWGYFETAQEARGWGATWDCQDAASLREVCVEAGLLSR